LLREKVQGGVEGPRILERCGDSRSLRVVGNQVVEALDCAVGAAGRKDLTPGDIQLNCLAVGAIEIIDDLVTVVARAGRRRSIRRGDGQSRGLTTGKNVLPLTARVRQGDDFISNTRQLVCHRVELAGVEGPVVGTVASQIACVNCEITRPSAGCVNRLGALAMPESSLELKPKSEQKDWKGLINESPESDSVQRNALPLLH